MHTSLSCRPTALSSRHDDASFRVADGGCHGRGVSVPQSGRPTRLAILNHLALGEHRVVELTSHLGLAQSTVSAHLACLRDCGLISSRPQGRASVFSLARPELFDLLGAAERVLAATGDAVTLCPNYGNRARR